MPRMSKRDKLYWSFFIDPATGRRKFNHVCRCCARDCKQSYRAELICCPKYLGKRSKEARTGIAGSRPQKARKTANLPENGFWRGNM